MDYQQALSFIESYTDYEKTPVPHAAANYDLRRVKEILARLGNPHLKAKTVHITGTKGKGSTAAMIASVLKCSGFTTALYTSPHLLTINERIRINGTPISNEDFALETTRIMPDIETVNQKATYGQLTTFEILTAIGFSYFARKQAEYQVLEVGMGGTYDATNVIPCPDVAVITSISYDHTDILGKTLTAIAGEKCGIIKPGCIVVSSPQKEEAAEVIETACRERGARLIEVGKDVTWQALGFDITQQSLDVQGRLDKYRLSIPLLGEYQLCNAATAVAALEVLNEGGFRITKDKIHQGLSSLRWPGRLQVVSRNPLIVLDGAHNADSAHKLREALEQYLTFERAILVIGASSDKDIAGITAGLAPLFNNVIATRSRHTRSMTTERIAFEFARYGITVQTAQDVPEALSQAKMLAGNNGLVCVTGSLFVVAEALQLFS